MLASDPLSTIQRLIILRSFEGFADLSPSEVNALADLTRKRFFKEGAVLSEEGAPTRSIQFIVSGKVALSRHGHDMSEFGPGSAVGGLNWLARDPDTPRMVALEDTVTLEVLVEDMEDLFEDNFGFFVGVCRAMVRIILELRRQLGQRAGYDEDGEPAPYPERELDLVERIFHLRQTLTFAHTRIEALANMARAAVEVRLSPGDVLWREGDMPDRLLFPVCGLVRASTKEGQEFTFKPGGSFGGLDLLANQPRWYTVEVVEPMVALQFDQELFLDMLEDHPAMARDFQGVLAQGLLGLMEKQAGHAHDHDHEHAA